MLFLRGEELEYIAFGIFFTFWSSERSSVKSLKSTPYFMHHPTDTRERYLNLSKAGLLKFLKHGKMSCRIAFLSSVVKRASVTEQNDNSTCNAVCGRALRSMVLDISGSYS